MNYFARIALCLITFPPTFVAAQATRPFDGTPWNVSTGNLSVVYIQASPIGAIPRPSFREPPPAVDGLKQMKADGLVAYEDYVAWGAVERVSGKWDWDQHDANEAAVHAAGLKYVVYNWTHFPPTWLRDETRGDDAPAGQRRTLMKCLEHGRETNYLSIFDPETVKHYDRYYMALADHFGDKIDGVYACVLGPFGEGNYPLQEKAWVDMGHCHEGYWCGDAHAIRAFREAMTKRYGDVAAVNKAWGTKLATMADIAMPPEAADEKHRPRPAAFATPADRRRWLDFIEWYHQALIDFSEQSIRAALAHFPAPKVRLKPGGNAGGVNPIAWGTYCPGYAKMAAKYPGVVLQPADWHGAYFGDKWIATAYHHYGVPLATEPAGGLDHPGFLRRLFSDASCGTRQLFTYDYPTHAADVRAFAHLVTGQPGETEIAVLCPTTLYRLGGDMSPTLRAANALRDLTDYDVLDELLVLDGALKADRYKALVIFQGEVIDRPVLDKLQPFLDAGGRIFVGGKTPMADVDGKPFAPAAGTAERLVQVDKGVTDRLKAYAAEAKPKGWDGVADGVWTTRRGEQTILYNMSDKAAKVGSEEVGPRELRESTSLP